jgi:hypothetical protein
MAQFGLGSTYDNSMLDMAKSRRESAKAAETEYGLQRVQSDALREQLFRESAGEKGDTVMERVESLINRKPELANRIAAAYYNTPQGRTSMFNRNDGRRLTGHGGFKQLENGNWVSQFTKQPTELGWSDKLQNLGNYITGEDQIVPATLYQTDKAEDTVLENSLYNWTNPMLHNMGISDSAFQQRINSHNEPVATLKGTGHSEYNTAVTARNNQPSGAVMDAAIKRKDSGLDPLVQKNALDRDIKRFESNNLLEQQQEKTEQAKSAASQQVAKEFSNIKQKELEIAGTSRVKALESTITLRNTLSNKIKEAHDQIRKATLEVQQKEGKLYNEYDKTQRGILAKIPVGTERRNNQLIKMIDRLTHNINDHNRTKKENGRSLFTNDKITEMKSRLKDLTKDYTTNWQSSLRATGAFQTDSGNMFSDFLDASMQDQGAFDTIMKMIPGGRESDQAQWGPGVAARILNENGEYKYFRNAEDKLQYQDKISKGDDIGLDFLEPDSMVTYTPKGDNQQPRRGTLKSVAENLGISSDELIPDGYLTNRQQQIQEFKGVRDRHDNWRETLQIPSGILDPFRRGELQKRGAGWSLSILDKALEDPHANLRNKRRKLTQVDVKQEEDVGTTKLAPIPWENDPEKDELGNQIGRTRFGNDKLMEELSGLNALLHKLEQTAQ